MLRNKAQTGANPAPENQINHQQRKIRHAKTSARKSPESIEARILSQKPPDVVGFVAADRK
ncbi:MAG: hypothetical protein KGM99_11310 [Burkholderiales bacterium]|nr:hypothetical protein [Burkholderiales bacterium]